MSLNLFVRERGEGTIQLGMTGLEPVHSTRTRVLTPESYQACGVGFFINDGYPADVRLHLNTVVAVLPDLYMRAFTLSLVNFPHPTLFDTYFLLSYSDPSRHVRCAKNDVVF